MKFCRIAFLVIFYSVSIFSLDIFETRDNAGEKAELKTRSASIIIQRKRLREKYFSIKEYLDTHPWNEFYLSRDNNAVAFTEPDGVSCFYLKEATKILFSNNTASFKKDPCLNYDGSIVAWIEDRKVVIGKKNERKLYFIDGIELVENIEMSDNGMVLVEYNNGSIAKINTSDMSIIKIKPFNVSTGTNSSEVKALGYYKNGDIEPQKGELSVFEWHEGPYSDIILFDGTKLMLVSNPNGYRRTRTPSLSAEGKYIAYVEQIVDKEKIFAFNIDTKEMIIVKETPISEPYGNIVFDRSSIETLYYEKIKNEHIYNIFRVNVEGNLLPDIQYKTYTLIERLNDSCNNGVVISDFVNHKMLKYYIKKPLLETDRETLDYKKFKK